MLTRPFVAVLLLDASTHEAVHDGRATPEIVLYGASGFTGKLVAEYLAEEHSQLNWAIAGRDEEKLDEVRRAWRA